VKLTPIPADGRADNQTASQLGELSRKASAAQVGDDIDRGLRLLRLLREAGFVIGRAA
jgi:hypothetical protein